MLKILVMFSLLFTALYANSSLFYKVHKGSKSLGYYEINYNDSKNNIVTKSYGMSNKVSFFLNKNIQYINEGQKDISFKKNKIVNNFVINTKLDLLDTKTKKKFKRKLKKVKNNDMLLLTKVGKDSIELFNKRKITILTLEEILKISLDKNIQERNIIFFEKSGVMKMIARIVPTSTGFDIINKSKNTKYIKVTVKNNIPIEVSSYISDWSLHIYGAGKFNIHKVSQEQINKNILNILNKKFNNKNISLLNIEKTSLKRKKYLVDFNLKINHSSNMGKEDIKRHCKKISKKYSKKIIDITYNDNSCTALLRVDILSKDIIDPLKKELFVQYPQLKFTKKFRTSKKGLIMYKIIDQVK